MENAYFFQGPVLGLSIPFESLFISLFRVLINLFYFETDKQKSVSHSHGFRQIHGTQVNLIQIHLGFLLDWIQKFWI